MAQGTFQITIKGLDDLVDDANRAGGMFPELMKQAMVRSTTIIQEDARAVKPGRFKNQTGNLRRSIFRRVKSANKGVVGVGEEYGYHVEFGSDPHTILPRRKKFLAFKKDGRWIYARRVRHPGSRPYPFMEPAFRDNIGKVLQEYEVLADTIMNVLAQKT